MKKFILAHAHCDLPCGVYDPQQATIEAKAVLEILKKAAKKKDDSYFTMRSIVIKDRVCEEVKKHINILHSDYFTANHFEQYPELHRHIHTALQFARKAKASDSVENGEKLIDEIEKIAEIFYKTKEQ